MSLQAEMIQKQLLEANMEEGLDYISNKIFNKSLKDLTDKEAYYVILLFTKDLTKVTDRINGEKKIYYISAEFLIGRLLTNNLINLGIYDKVAEVLKKNGKDISMLEEAEPEPSLGNGGLGRLAACFMDSIATLGLPGAGIGLNYHFGLFNRSSETIFSAQRRTNGLRIFRGSEKPTLLLRWISPMFRLSQDYMTLTLSATKTVSTNFISSTLKALTKNLSKRESLLTKKQLKRI